METQTIMEEEVVEITVVATAVATIAGDIMEEEEVAGLEETEEVMGEVEEVGEMVGAGAAGIKLNFESDELLIRQYILGRRAGFETGLGSHGF